MSEDRGRAPLDRIAGAAGPAATGAFKLLGNDTRLAILIALWEAYEPLASDNGVPFSTLRERVGTADSGQFNYHLDQLTDHFVRQSASGYELRVAGFKIVRAVIAGTGFDETTLAPAAVELACNRCGASPIEVSYRGEAVHLTCGSCEGFIADERFPEGIIGHFEFEPAGLASRDVREALVGSWLAENLRLRSLLAGVCPECSGTVRSDLVVCAEHEAGATSVCRSCGRRDAARVRHVCSVCKYWNEGPAQSATIGHPRIVAFFADHGVDLRVHVQDFEGFSRAWELIWDMTHRVVSADPVRVEVTVPCRGEELRLTMDGSLNVVEVTGPD